MVFIFCQSYLSVVDTMNAVKREQGDFLVLSSNSSIVKLFSELYSPQNVFLLPSTEIVFSRPLSILRSLIRIQSKKKEILPLLLKRRPDKVIFFFMGFNGFESWLIKKISRVARIYYRPGTNPDVFQRSYNVKTWVKGFFYSAIYRIHFEPKRLGEYCFEGVSDSFLSVVKARKYPESLDMKYVDNILRRKYFELQELKILMLVGGEPNVDSDSNMVINEILKRLVHYVKPDEIGIKAHPRFVVPDLDIPVGSVMFPQYLAANLLMLNCQVVISYASGTLFEAANVGKKAISLLRILKSVSQKRADTYEDYLLANTNGEICFPETIDALLREIRKELSRTIKK